MRHTSERTSTSRNGRMRRNWVRIALLPGLIALGFALVIGLHLDRYLTFDALAANRSWLLSHVAETPTLAALAFAAVYVAAVTFSLPGSSILTMSAGFLFGVYLGTAMAVVAATIFGVLGLRQRERDSVIGVVMAFGLGLGATVSDVVLYHHERLGGKGYPAGLRGADIPFLARLAAVADVYDALVMVKAFLTVMANEGDAARFGIDPLARGDG